LRSGVNLTPLIGRRIPPGGSSEFTFLNRSQYFPDGKIDWRSLDKDKLWRYNLHYFDYILDQDRPRASVDALIDDWIAQNPPGTPDTWEPFPVSLRIVNWVKLLLRPEYRERTNAGWLNSLHQQAHWLERNLEKHLLANHYFKNGKALLFAGLFFTGVDADRWLRKGLQIVDSEIGEQILPDGGHFERSPMYHAMILEDCMDLLNICAPRPERELVGLRDRLRGMTQRMTRYLLGMSHPDGEISLFNDAAFGIERTPAEIADYFQRVNGFPVSPPAGRCWSFPETGYYVMAPQPGNRLIVDCGPVGPDYQPGHSHCDTLSFELSLGGKRVVVDSGCSEYTDGEIRRYNRGNAGHNTLTVDRENQSEVWGAHRCARRAYPLYARLEEQAEGALVFSGAHDGYRRLSGSPIHHRKITWEGDSIQIEDRVEGKGMHAVEIRLHIHPGFQVDGDGRNAVVRDRDRQVMEITLPGEGRIEVQKGWYCPEFGVRLECPVLSATFRDVPLPFRTGWSIRTAS
jgi:uncharacterized heparinase superfamily protein